MRIFVRTDASELIGSGHIMRCLSLADRLRDSGNEVSFICRNEQDSLVPYIQLRGYEVAPVRPYVFGEEMTWEEDARQTIEHMRHANDSADWLIVDHYFLDARFESAVRPFVRKLMVIDDLADRMHHCDLLLDQNQYEDRFTRYEGLVGPDCKLLLGSAYALLRPEFGELRGNVIRNGKVRDVLVSFGGSDSTGETLKAIEALEPLVSEGLRLVVLTGKMNRLAALIMDKCSTMPGTQCYEHAENIASLMLHADLAIGSGGTTTWERCCLGLPALVITTASNQLQLTKHTGGTGAIRYLGESHKVDERQIRDAVRRMMRSPEELIWMSARAMELVDGRGANRIVEEVYACRN